MDTLLSEMGVNLVDEKVVQQRILREKIVKSITSSNPILQPTVRDLPQLSSVSLNNLLHKLRNEIDTYEPSTGGDYNLLLLKYRFLQNVCRKQSADAVELDPEDMLSVQMAPRNNTIQPDRPEVRATQTVNDEDVSRLEANRDMRVTFHRPRTRDRMAKVRDSEITKAKRNAMELSISQLHEEAKQSDDRQRGSTVESSKSDTRIPPSGGMSVPVPSTRSSLRTTAERTPDMTPVVSRRSQRRRATADCGSQGASSNVQEVQCPLCMCMVAIQPGSSADSVMDRHLDRCSRRSSTLSSSSADRCRPNKRLIAHDEIDFADAEEEESVDGDVEYEWNSSPRSGTCSAVSDDDDELEHKGTTASSTRKSNAGSRVKGDTVTVVDDWELEVYLARLQSHREGITNLLSASHSTNLESQQGSGLSEPPRPPNEGAVLTPHGAWVDGKAWENLYVYQREGTEWMWNLYRSGGGSGGILGDEMGLGKTAQLCVHYSAVAWAEKERYVQAGQRQSPMLLIVCPATVQNHWLREMHRWAPELRTVIMHSISPSFAAIQSVSTKAIGRALQRISSPTANHPAPDGVVVVVSYEGLRRMKGLLLNTRWAAVCLDEGQKIKNPDAEITSVCKALPSYHRLILSGTPIQNSLKELWSLFDFVFPGRLGTLTAFEIEFADPIRIGGYSTATHLQSEIAIRTATTLQAMIRPFLLRRRKDDVIGHVSLPNKTEQVIFCVLSPQQREIYKEVISSPEVERAIRRMGPAFKAIMTLRKLCNHPLLAYQQGSIKWHKSDSISSGDCDEDPDVARLRTGDIPWEESGKLLVLQKILPLWKSENHKVLIFCQMHGMMHMIDVMLGQLGLSYMRLDGLTPVSKRDGIVRKFNTDDSVFALLLTTRTGGVGISLTAANRVVVVDPDWNPQTDIQARERAWRIGQKREVTVYRLVTKGTIEEKIYQRQIFKLLLTNRILDNPRQKRFFSHSDIRELFELGGSDDNPVEKYLDLPMEGEVDLEQDEDDREDTDVTQGNGIHHRGDETSDGGYVIAPVENPTAQSPADTSSGTDDRDRRLLQALFNGEAISAVYDHGYFEGGSSRSRRGQGRAQDARVSELARKAVDDALVHLRNSNNIYPDNVPPESSAFRASSRGRGRGRGAASMLAGLRRVNGRSSAGSEPPPHTNSTIPIQTGDGSTVSILARLQRVFRQPAAAQGLTTEAILENFRDLPDQFAPVFREMLRRVATFSNGRWVATSLD
mmetsp:Transcript_23102/g.33843  ORF Transcript_23102/g.33843 Transcript_23102/m.33843 type:complete len:1238 (+) Transcript_23102:142-3855(+)